MTQNEFLRICFGLVGTGSSLVLANAETAAAIFAGLATGLYMLVSIFCKLRRKK